MTDTTANKPSETLVETSSTSANTGISPEGKADDPKPGPLRLPAFVRHG